MYCEGFLTSLSLPCFPLLSLSLSLPLSLSPFLSPSLSRSGLPTSLFILQRLCWRCNFCANATSPAPFLRQEEEEEEDLKQFLSLSPLKRVSRKTFRFLHPFARFFLKEWSSRNSWKRGFSAKSLLVDVDWKSYFQVGIRQCKKFWNLISDSFIQNRTSTWSHSLLIFYESFESLTLTRLD